MNNVDIMNSKLHFAPINLGYSIDGEMNDKIIHFMKLRANKSIGINILGNVAIDRVYSTNSSTLILSKQSNIEKWREYIKQCSVNNSIPGIQIAAMPSDLNPPRNWASSNTEIKFTYLKKLLENVSMKDILKLLNSFEETIKLARDIGFKYIEIHAAHGYFLSLLINSSINENKESILAVLEFLKTFAENPNTINSIRLSYFDGHSHLQSFDKRILDIKFDFISLSNGYYTINKKLIYPAKGILNLEVIEQGILLSKKRQIMIAGNIREVELTKYMLIDNLHFAIGRPLIADHLFAEKYLADDIKSIKQCSYNGKCHYYSNKNEGGLVCPIWEQ